MAINAPIQGTAADCMRIAMLRVHDYIEQHKETDSVRMLLQVHDELVFEIQKELVEKVVSDIVALMEGVLSEKESQGVPLVAEVKAGLNWNELTKLKL